MQPTVRRQQSERRPTLVHVGRSGRLEAADIVAVVAEAAESERQSAAQSLGHRHILGGAVSAPVDGELLRAGRRAAGKQAGFAVAVVFGEQLIYRLVVEIGVVVVHIDWVGAVMIDRVGRYALAEVGFEIGHAHVEQFPQL